MAAHQSGAVEVHQSPVNCEDVASRMRSSGRDVGISTLREDGKDLSAYSSPRYSNRFAKTLVDRLARGEVIAELPGGLLLAAVK